MGKNVLITGGAGFIGSNCAQYYIAKGDNVYIYDNLSRAGVTKNLEWLKECGSYEFIKGDVGDFEQVEKAFRGIPAPDYIFHFAGQVAVTTSVTEPRKDLYDNIVGTFNVLEGMRKYAPEAALLYSSTNKVYGNLEASAIEETDQRYVLKEYADGISENTLLDFYSPYGCSKGGADQYVRDYARIYKLKTVVFRQSCIYGYRQLGVEDQGWVAWFIISAFLGRGITLYGTGKQVRDVLFISDLIAAIDLAVQNIDKTAGKIYNIGGGPQNKISLLDLIDKMKQNIDNDIQYGFSDWRQGDQLVYVSDISKALAEFGWSPKVNVDEGVNLLIDWVRDNLHHFK